MAEHGIFKACVIAKNLRLEVPRFDADRKSELVNVDRIRTDHSLKALCS